MLIHLPSVGPEVSTSAFAPQLTHKRENEVHRMQKDKIIDDWDVQKLGSTLACNKLVLQPA